MKEKAAGKKQIMRQKSRIYPDKGFKALVVRILIELGKRKDEHNENYLVHSSCELSKVGT